MLCPHGVAGLPVKNREYWDWVYLVGVGGSGLGEVLQCTGIFMVYCPHGVCYGFDIMKRCESPHHLFNIFTSCFPVPLKAIVYNNRCKLHLHHLNREPALYQGIRFFINQFYWKGHIGYSKGYCLDEYMLPEIRSLNSQVNEQAKPEYFIFTLSLFLAICKKDN